MIVQFSYRSCFELHIQKSLFFTDVTFFFQNKIKKKEVIDKIGVFQTGSQLKSISKPRIAHHKSAIPVLPGAGARNCLFLVNDYYE
jgi:hypothetical protein